MIGNDSFAIAKKRSHFKKGDDYFYEEGKELDSDFSNRIKEVLLTKNAIRGYPKTGAKIVKFCGFHADYMVTLKTETQKIDIQICYGCGDIKLFLDDVYVDEYDMGTEHAFKKWTDPYSGLGSIEKK